MNQALENRFDLLIHGKVEQRFPQLLEALGPYAWLIIKAQVWQESRFQATARSHVGACGLMQLMPGTDMEIDGDIDAFEPFGNVDNGVRYMSTQWDKLDEFPDPMERIRAALASYNGGRGYINMAMVLAREAEGIQASHKLWRRVSRPAGKFQQWIHLQEFLKDPRCKVRGRTPDHHQMTDYVARIEGRFNHYLPENVEVS